MNPPIMIILGYVGLVHEHIFIMICVCGYTYTHARTEAHVYIINQFKFAEDQRC